MLIKRKHRHLGLSLIELMVAMVIGIIAITATLGIFSTTVSNNAYQTKALKVQSSLSGAMTQISRDFRRVGYSHWISSNTLTANWTNTQPKVVNPDSRTIYFSYDLESNGGSDSFGYRWDGSQTLQTCNTACTPASATWIAMNDPNEIQFTGFSISKASGTFFTAASQTIEIPAYTFTISARHVNADETQRTLVETVRSRNVEVTSGTLSP